MYRVLLLLALLPHLGFGQSLVSLAPQDRTVLLEDFTGIHCGYCPEGHVIANDLEALHGPRIAVVGVHAGAFAVPAVGEPDFRTTEGTAIDAYFTIGGYPAGVINRHTFNGQNDLGRGAWAGAVDEMLALPSPVNLGVASSFEPVGRVLTVTVELLYTADSPGGDDYISVLLKEDHIIGPQTDYGPSGNHTDYDHMHVLRDYITELWGDVVTTTTQGTSVTRTYTFTVPEEWDIANCQVVAFVSEDHVEVYQAREVAADGGTTLVVGDLVSSDPAFTSGTNGAPSVFDVTLTNLMGANADYLITLTSYGSPGSWASAMAVDGTPVTNPATIAVADAGSSGISVSVTPDGTPGIGRYVLSVAAVDAPGASVLEQEFNIISGITDLVVTHAGAEEWEAIYLDGLAQAGNMAYAATMKDKYLQFGEAGALAGVNNLYVNVSWTFPALTDDEVTLFTAHMDAGGDLMIAGQDIGWDQSGATGSYGTPATQAFFADYMHATYVADGSTANSSVNFFDTDAVFGTVPNSTIANVFGSNSYPEEINPIAPAVGILHYNSNVNKIGGLRCENGTYKVVYFGVGPEQMGNAAVARSMVQLSHDWFYGVVGVEEYDALLAAALGQAYPVPASDGITIPLHGLEESAELDVFDATGRRIMTLNVAAGTDRIDLDISALVSGLYRYTIRNAGGMVPAKAFQVIR